MDGIDILKKVKTENPNIPVVIISGHGNIEIAVSAIKQGAYDFMRNLLNRATFGCCKTCYGNFEKRE